MSGTRACAGPSVTWDRPDWLAFADRLLEAVQPHFDAAHALLTLPGPHSGSGAHSDQLEGYARTFLLAALRIAAQPDTAHALVADYRRGLLAGTDPQHPARWPQLRDCRQAKVEAASIALALDLTRPWLWEQLTEAQRQQVIAWFAPSVNDRDYVDNNWLWFQVVTETFLASVQGPWSVADMARCLQRLEEFYRADGWYSDGANRNYDYYCGWAMQFYPVLWSRMRGYEGVCAAIAAAMPELAPLTTGRPARDRERLVAYVADAVHMVGGDGAPVFQGRSLIYRFAAAAVFWLPALAGVSERALADAGLSYGMLRGAAHALVHYFLNHDVPDAAGLLRLGWQREWAGMREYYSGSCSPYWAAKAFIGLLVPADHPAWTAPPEPLPIERGDFLRAIDAPGWILAGTRADGIVRLYNAGSDRQAAPTVTAGCGWDNPRYARIGYSTMTTPLLDRAAGIDPTDQAVCVIAPAHTAVAGQRSHRAGWLLLRNELTTPQLAFAAAGMSDEAVNDEAVSAAFAEATLVGLQQTRMRVHWPEFGAAQPGEGPDFPQTELWVSAPMCDGGSEIEVTSIISGPHEVRCVRMLDAATGSTGAQQPPRNLQLEVSGWALTGLEVGANEAGTVVVTVPEVGRARPLPQKLQSSLAISACLCARRESAGEFVCAHRRGADASPLVGQSIVPYARGELWPGKLVCFLVSLSGA